MSTTFKGRFGTQLFVSLSLFAGLSFIVLTMNAAYPGHLLSMIFTRGRLSGALVGSAIVSFILLVHIVMRPILVVDSVGARVKNDFSRFDVRWDDVESIGTTAPRKQRPL